MIHEGVRQRDLPMRHLKDRVHEPAIMRAVHHLEVASQPREVAFGTLAAQRAPPDVEDHLPLIPLVHEAAHRRRASSRGLRSKYGSWARDDPRKRRVASRERVLACRASCAASGASSAEEGRPRSNARGARMNLGITVGLPSGDGFPSPPFSCSKSILCPTR